jgi:hypothetical protein
MLEQIAQRIEEKERTNVRSFFLFMAKDKFVKRKHWSGVSGIFGLQGAPVLEFDRPVGRSR